MFSETWGISVTVRTMNSRPLPTSTWERSSRSAEGSRDERRGHRAAEELDREARFPYEIVAKTGPSLDCVRSAVPGSVRRARAPTPVELCARCDDGTRASADASVAITLAAARLRWVQRPSYLFGTGPQSSVTWSCLRAARRCGASGSAGARRRLRRRRAPDHRAELRLRRSPGSSTGPSHSLPTPGPTSRVERRSRRSPDPTVDGRSEISNLIVPQEHAGLHACQNVPRKMGWRASDYRASSPSSTPPSRKRTCWANAGAGCISSSPSSTADGSRSRRSRSVSHGVRTWTKRSRYAAGKRRQFGPARSRSFRRSSSSSPTC